MHLTNDIIFIKLYPKLEINIPKSKLEINIPKSKLEINIPKSKLEINIPNKIFQGCI